MDTDLHRPISHLESVSSSRRTCPGGAPLNFAARVQAFGHPTQIISRVGQTLLVNRRCWESKVGLSTSCIQEDTHPATGTVEIQLDAFGNAITYPPISGLR